LPPSTTCRRCLSSLPRRPPRSPLFPYTTLFRSQEYITRAVALAKRRAAATDVSVFDWIQDVLMLRFPEWADAEHRKAQHQDVLRSEEHTSELQSLTNLVCRLLLEKKNNTRTHAK